MTSPSAAPRSAGATVFSNAVLFAGAQALVAPLTIATSLLTVRFLGPREVALSYLATTFVGLAAQVAEWGQSAPLTAAVARAPHDAPSLLASGALGRLAGLAISAPGLLAATLLLRDEPRLLAVVSLSFVATVFALLSAAMGDVLRGLERADAAASSWVALQVAGALAALVTLLAGGRLQALLLVQIAVQATGVLIGLFVLSRLGIRPAQARMAQARSLLLAGTPFVLFGLLLTLQGNVEAFFLARLARPEVVGWFSAARRLLGPLLVPAGALVSALYPTLCRLSSEPAAMLDVARAALGKVLIVAVPAALGCVLFAALPTWLFGPRFAGAEPVIRAFGPFLFVLYATMPIGSLLAASGRQRAWTLVQLGALGVSVVAYPLLIDVCETRFHNGGVGAAAAALVNELFTLAGAIAVAPAGLIDGRLLRQLGAVTLAGGAMTITALVCTPLGLLASALLSLFAYGLVALTTGALRRDELRAVAERIRRRLG